MNYETIEIHKNNKTVTIILNRPEVHNALNEQLMKELIDCFKKLDRDNDIRIIILSGKGKSFCAGADLNWMKSMVNYSKEENIEDSKLLLNLFEAIYNCSKPVIGRINGHAFGGGLGLLAVCDINVAKPNLKFAFSEVKLGIIPSVISSFIVKRINLAYMRRLFITGEKFDSDYAKEIGLIDYIVPDEEFDSKINEYIEKILSSGPIAIGEIKNLVDKYQELDLEKYKTFTVEKISELRISEEGQEGINAFLEKRKTKWSD
jgi:methylglutaconyl-CoA hydratase